jgi:hypothetical protein
MNQQIFLLLVIYCKQRYLRHTSRNSVVMHPANARLLLCNKEVLAVAVVDVAVGAVVMDVDLQDVVADIRVAAAEVAMTAGDMAVAADR